MPKQHSATFIQAMKALLEEEKAKLGQDLGESAQFPIYGQNEEDNATEIADYTATSAVSEEKEARLREVEAALRRIEEGTYGLTSDGKMIPEKRLRANPAATTLVT